MWNVQDKTGMTVASMDPMVRTSEEMELGQCTSTLHAAQLLCLPDLLFSPPTCTPTENGTQGDPYELYKQQFDERYNGNRAPLGIFIHAAWLIADPT